MKLPDSWALAPLGSVTSIVGGGTPSRSNSGYFNGEIPWATPTDVTKLDDIYISRTAESITEDALRRSSAKLLPPGAVLMTSRATIGYTAIATRAMTTNQGFASFICDPEILHNEYLARWLGSSREHLIRRAGGTTFKEISKSALASLQVPIPPIEEQKRIVAILVKADELRRMRRDALERSRNISSVLFQEMFGDPIANSRKWSRWAVSDFVEQLEGGRSIVGAEDGNSRNRVLKISAVTSGEFSPTESKSLPDGYSPPPRHFVRPGDLLFSRANTEELVGATCHVFDAPDNLVLPDKIWRFVWRSGVEVEPLFVLHLFSQPGIRKQLSRLATGSGGSMKNIAKSKLLAFKVIFPDLSAQKLFAIRALDIRAHVCRARRNEEDLNRTIYALTGSAFSGELTRAWRASNDVADINQASPRRLRVRISEVAAEERPWQSQTHRRWLATQISDFQSSVRLALQEWKGTLVPTEHMEEFIRSWPIEHLAGQEDHIERALNELAGLGLIARLSIPNDSGDYVTAYRGLREDELSRVDDLDVIKLALGDD